MAEKIPTQDQTAPYKYIAVKGNTWLYINQLKNDLTQKTKRAIGYDETINHLIKEAQK